MSPDTAELAALVDWMRGRGVRRLRSGDLELELGDPPVESVPLDFGEESHGDPVELKRRRDAGLCSMCGAAPPGGMMREHGYCRECSRKVVHAAA